MMTARGLAKLSEECGELIQVIGKKLAYYTTDEHPDGKKPLRERLEDEIADVMAACDFVVEAMGLDRERVASRRFHKRDILRRWHADPDNNAHAIDGPR